MGIFGDIVEGIEAFAGSEFGQAAIGFGLQRLLPPPPQPRGFPPPMRQAPVGRPVSRGGFVSAGGGPPGSIIQTRFPEFPPLPTNGGPTMGVFQTAGLGGIVQAPQPVPFGFDPACPSFFKEGGMRATPTRFITATNPATGSLTFWEHAGQPILFARDLRVCKRVQKIGRRFGTVSRRLSRKR